MTTKATFSLNGIDAWLEDVARIEADIDQVAPEVLVSAGTQVQRTMQALVPVDTGNLQNHIVVDGPRQDGNFHYVEIGVIGADANTATYGNVIEYGSTRQAAQPYIRPGLARNRGAIKAALLEFFARFGISAS